MQEVKINQGNLADFLRKQAGPNCSLGLHEIGLNRTKSPEETANQILVQGLENKRSGTSYFTVTYYGKSGWEREINNYNCYGSIPTKTIVVVAIPEFFEMSDGSIIYGGYFTRRYKTDDKGNPECITDQIFSTKIPKELILGYYTYDIRDRKTIYKTEVISTYNPSTGTYENAIEQKPANIEYKDLTFHINPYYYHNLSQEEKEEFIKKYYQKDYCFNIKDSQSIERIYGLNNYYSVLTGKDNFLAKTIKQYESSYFYQEKKKKQELKTMMQKKEEKKGFKVISRTD